jgi:hypothetical protein
VQRKSQGFPWKRTKPVIVRLTTPALSELSASGGCDITLAPFPNRTLALKLSGGINLEAKGLELDQLTVETSGGVEATLAGQCREASVDLSGGVVLDARALTITSAAVQASGGCQLTLTVLETVGGDANGGVDLVVHGHPRWRAGVSGARAAGRRQAGRAWPRQRRGWCAPSGCGDGLHRLGQPYDGRARH